VGNPLPTRLQRCIPYSMKNGSTETFQRHLPFPREPLSHTGLRKPPFQREDAPVGTYKGISPREAFALVDVLLALGLTERDIAPKLIETVARERYWIEGLLKRMESGKAIDAVQSAQAMQVRSAMLQQPPEGLTDMELALWLHELNISKLRENEQSIPWGSLRVVQTLRRAMGQFRQMMPKIFESLQNGSRSS